jgi:ABC-type spermidine/putrescine transport system permease subunit II
MPKPSASGDSMRKDASRKSPHRSTVATLLSIEAGIVLALGLWLIFFSITHENEELAPLLGEISFAAIGALGLFVAGRGYARGKNYGRSPAILANLIALGVAYYQIQGRFYIGAVIILVLAIPTLYLAFSIAKSEG